MSNAANIWVDGHAMKIAKGKKASVDKDAQGKKKKKSQPMERFLGSTNPLVNIGLVERHAKVRSKLNLKKNKQKKNKQQSSSSSSSLVSSEDDQSTARETEDEESPGFDKSREKMYQLKVTKERRGETEGGDPNPSVGFLTDKIEGKSSMKGSKSNKASKKTESIDSGSPSSCSEGGSGIKLPGGQREGSGSGRGVFSEGLGSWGQADHHHSGKKEQAGVGEGDRNSPIPGGLEQQARSTESSRGSDSQRINDTRQGGEVSDTSMAGQFRGRSLDAPPTGLRGHNNPLSLEGRGEISAPVTPTPTYNNRLYDRPSPPGYHQVFGGGSVGGSGKTGNLAPTVEGVEEARLGLGGMSLQGREPGLGFGTGTGMGMGMGTGAGMGTGTGTGVMGMAGMGMMNAGMMSGLDGRFMSSMGGVGGPYWGGRVDVGSEAARQGMEGGRTGEEGDAQSVEAILVRALRCFANLELVLGPSVGIGLDQVQEERVVSVLAREFGLSREQALIALREKQRIVHVQAQQYVASLLFC